MGLVINYECHACGERFLTPFFARGWAVCPNCGSGHIEDLRKRPTIEYPPYPEREARYEMERNASWGGAAIPNTPQSADLGVYHISKIKKWLDFFNKP